MYFWCPSGLPERVEFANICPSASKVNLSAQSRLYVYNLTLWLKGSFLANAFTIGIGIATSSKDPARNSAT